MSCLIASARGTVDMVRGCFSGMSRMGGYVGSGLLALLRSLCNHVLSFFGLGEREREAELEADAQYADRTTTTVTMRMKGLPSDEKLQRVRDQLSEEDEDDLIGKRWPTLWQRDVFFDGVSTKEGEYLAEEEVNQLISMLQTDRLFDLYSGQSVFLRIGDEGRWVTINTLLGMSEEEFKTSGATQFLFLSSQPSPMLATSPTPTKELVEKIFSEELSRGHLMEAWNKFLLVPLEIPLEIVITSSENMQTGKTTYRFVPLKGSWGADHNVTRNLPYYGRLITRMLKSIAMIPAFVDPEDPLHEFPRCFWEALQKRIFSLDDESDRKAWRYSAAKHWNPIVKRLGLETI